jgi:hypothetical protein
VPSDVTVASIEGKMEIIRIFILRLLRASMAVTTFLECV